MSIIIVVDDNEIDRRIIELSLVKYTLFDKVLYYGEGMSLMNYLKENADNYENLPDAIFLDLRMPDYDGWSVLNDINQIYPALKKDIGVYITTASISSQDRFRALKYDFVHKFISKPITKDILISISHDLQSA